MIKRLLAALVIATAFASAYAQDAQQARANEKVDRDDDGGRLFLVRKETAQLDELQYHGGDVMSHPRQLNVFLGKDWSDPKLRAEQSQFSDLLAGPNDSPDRTALARFSITATRTGTASAARSAISAADQQRPRK